MCARPLEVFVKSSPIPWGPLRTVVTTDCGPVVSAGVACLGAGALAEGATGGVGGTSLNTGGASLGGWVRPLDPVEVNALAIP